MLQRKLKLVSQQLDLKRKFTSHSMRRGGVEWAYRNGVPESLIKVHGDWSSDAFKRYLTFPVELRDAVSEKMVEKLRHF